jgi:hypothetical protein
MYLAAGFLGAVTVAFIAEQGAKRAAAAEARGEKFGQAKSAVAGGRTDSDGQCG